MRRRVRSREVTPDANPLGVVMAADAERLRDSRHPKFRQVQKLLN